MIIEYINGLCRDNGKENGNYHIIIVTFGESLAAVHRCSLGRGPCRDGVAFLLRRPCGQAVRPGGFPKLGVSFWGPHNKKYSRLGSKLGPLIVGNYFLVQRHACDTAHLTAAA